MGKYLTAAHGEDLCRRLEEAEQTLEAIRRGDVDALVVAGPQGEQIYSLNGAERVYRVIVETMNEAALTVDANGTILFCNRRFCELFKTPVQGRLGHKVTTFAAPPQQGPLQRLLVDAQAGPVRRRLTLRAADGTAVPVQLAASPLREGSSVSICLVASDLTEVEASTRSVRILREHQQTLEESEERFRAFMDNSTAVAWIKDKEGRYVYLSKPYQQRFGIRLEDCEGKTDFDLWPRETAEQFRRSDLQVLRTGRALTCIEQTINPDGRPSHWWNSKFLMQDSQGRRWVGGIGIDITERKQAEEALRELSATLESKVAQRTEELTRRASQLQKLTLELLQAEERERRRIALILHEDLQQQIVGAKLQLNLLSPGVKPDPAQQSAAAQAQEILKGVLGMSRSLSHELSPAIFYGNDLSEALDWLAEQTEALQGLNVQVEVSGEGPLHSEALTIFLFRAARELLSNTIRHAGVCEAKIRLRRMGRYVGLRVRDHGRGFDPRTLRETAGLGLLSLRERVELLGGRTKIRSAAGRGTIVRIVLPDVSGDGDKPL